MCLEADVCVWSGEDFCVCMRWCVSGGVCIGVLLGHVVSGSVMWEQVLCVCGVLCVLCVCVRALYRGWCVWVVVCECSACGGMGGCVEVVRLGAPHDLSSTRWARCRKRAVRICQAPASLW